MPVRSRLLAGAAIAAVVTAALAPAAAAPGRGSVSAVGGALLARPGTVVAPGAPALPKPISAHSWLVADMTTGEVLAARGAHEKYLPASTLKTLTALTLLPRLDRSATFRATRRDALVDGTRVGLVPGYRYPIGKLFQAMLLDSANDAADALAQANGGFGKTLREMNAEAARLQADDTHAVTPSGLDGSHETISAYDLALIARAAMRLPAFRRIITTVHTRFPAPHGKHYQIWTHNYLLYTFRGDIGGKNGYTVAANATYWTACRRHGRTLLVTLLDANPDFWPDARALLRWGFRADGRVTPVGQLVPPLPAHPAVLAQPVGGPGGRSASQARPLVSGIGAWPWAALAATLAVLTLATLRRARRRRRRRPLTLPPL